MAEIPVEKKSGFPWWAWVLLALLLVALLWWLISAFDNDDDVVVADNAPVVEESMAPVPVPVVADANASIDIASILANPQAYIGKTYTADKVAVGEVATDRGFWITNGGKRMLAIVIDQPREVRVDINAGQDLRITGGTLMDATATASIPGEPLDADTKALLAQEPIFLLVDEKNIEIL